MTYTIQKRDRRLVNTDPQRRCYNGCHYSSELVWSIWDWLELNVPEDKVDKRLAFWRDLNEYAVSQRGEEAASEFRKIVEEKVL